MAQTDAPGIWPPWPRCRERLPYLLGPGSGCHSVAAAQPGRIAHDYYRQTPDRASPPAHAATPGGQGVPAPGHGCAPDLRPDSTPAPRLPDDVLPDSVG